MTRHVYARPASKPRVSITPELEVKILALLTVYSQQAVARRLGISQAAISKIVCRRKAAAAVAERSNATFDSWEAA